MVSKRLFILPWQNTFIRLPFPVTVIRIIPSILNTGKLPVDIRTRPVRIQGLDRTIKHPFSMNNITFLGIKIKSVICWKIKWFALQLCFITCQKKKRLVYSLYLYQIWTLEYMISSITLPFPFFLDLEEHGESLKILLEERKLILSV